MSDILKEFTKIITDSIYGILGDAGLNIEPKKISEIDKGFLESCLELDETGLAQNFLINIYKYSEVEALAYVVNLKVDMLKRKKDDYV